MTRSISILGATGSIGASTLDLIRRNRDAWRVVALTANGNVADLASLAREFGAEVAVCADAGKLGALREALGHAVEHMVGTDRLGPVHREHDLVGEPVGREVHEHREPERHHEAVGSAERLTDEQDQRAQ